MRMLVAENDLALATFLHDRFSAEHYTLDLTGDGEEVHSVALATQRAELAFEMFIQVRNKVVSAYQSVMQMQV